MTEDFVISNSQAKTWRRCPNQWRYKYGMKLIPKAKKVQLERGGWIHDCLMHHYDGEDWRIPHQEYVDEYNKQFEETREEWGPLPEEVERIMKSYLRHYRDEDANHHTIDSEMDEIITLPNGLKFRFIIDRIYEDQQGGLWLQDHKTLKNFYGDDFMVLDAQLTRYFWCAIKMGYTPLRGIEFNMIRTKPPTLPKLTTKTGMLERRMNIDCDYWNYLAEIKKHGFDIKPYMKVLRHLRVQEDKFFKRTQLPQDPHMMKTMMKELVETAQDIESGKRRKAFPRTPLKSCQWDCDYKSICVGELQGADIKSIIKHGYVKKPKESEVS